MAEQPAPNRYLSVRQAAFIGVGAMVGAGIFSLLGAAGEVAGAAVWVSFLLAGVIAGLQGYSFAKLGARIRRPAGLLEYVGQGFGDGHLTGIIGVAAVRGERHRDRDGGGVVRQLRQRDVHRRATRSAKVFAVLIVVVMTMLNVVGIEGRRRAQTRDRGHRDRHPPSSRWSRSRTSTRRCSRPPAIHPSGHRLQRGAHLLRVPGLRCHHLHREGPAQPVAPAASGDVPRALGIATIIYLAVSLGVFGTLTVDEVIASGGTALAVAAEPVLGQAGYWLMSVTATVRHRRRHQRRALPRGRPVRTAGANGSSRR